MYAIQQNHSLINTNTNKNYNKKDRCYQIFEIQAVKAIN